MSERDTQGFRPSSAVEEIEAYEVPTPGPPVDVHLDGNVGPLPPRDFIDRLEPPEARTIRDYPDRGRLRSLLADRLGVPKERLLVTAGADEAMMRTCRVALEPGRRMVLPQPTFSMLPRFAALAGGDPDFIDWYDGAFPLDDFREAASDCRGLVVVVSPNNPTGAVAGVGELEELAEAAERALLLIDHAYVEFCDENATGLAVRRDDVVVTRTLSKAWGLAGLRVGYAVAAPRVVDWLERAGNPYPVSAASLQFASDRLAGGGEDVEAYVEAVDDRRRALERRLDGYGVETTESGGNFVFGRFEDADWMHDALAGLGFGVRAFPDTAGVERALRITVPAEAEVFERLERALATIYRPEALFLDMDGVLVDVSESYRRAIIGAAEHFGLSLSAEEVSRAKSEGEANNDWILTQRLLAEAGIEAEYDEIKDVYETLYQGNGDAPGLWRHETMIPTFDRLESLAELVSLGIVTGRPRRDAERFFERTGLDGAVEAVVCMEDAPQKPEPDPVELLADRMGVDRGWMIGDTPDDARAARAAGALPFGTIAPGEEEETMRPALVEAGCAEIVEGLGELEERLRTMLGGHRE